MNAKVTSVLATAVALMIGASPLANAQPYPGYLPPPAYAYASPGALGGPDEIATPGDCGGAGFTILGARAGATVLGFDVGVGGHFGFGGSGGCPRPRDAPAAAYVSPPQPFYGPPAYPPMAYPPQPPAAYYAAPPVQPSQVFAPPYASPCGC